MKLYYHKTSGGAEYLTDNFIYVSRDGTKEGIFEGSKFIVRIDGDITKDAELSVSDDDKKIVRELKKYLKSKTDLFSAGCVSYEDKARLEVLEEIRRIVKGIK
jgi:hypothetical protein